MTLVAVGSNAAPGVCSTPDSLAPRRRLARMLLGREREMARLDRVLDDLRAGRSATLVLTGEPGIGKTALLEYAAGRADGMTVVSVRGIEPDAAAALLERSGHAIARATVDEIVAATAGNPLALLEVPSLLTAPQLAGDEPLPGPVPTSEVLERAFLAQVERLPAETQRALVIAAASSSGDFDEVVGAVARAGLEPDVLDEAERAGLTRVVGSRLEFAH